jgi:hypothetical protein
MGITQFSTAASQAVFLALSEESIIDCFPPNSEVVDCSSATSQDVIFCCDKSFVHSHSLKFGHILYCNKPSSVCYVIGNRYS